ncbi:secoisolariciresinol dehydrogenase-like [Sesamum indicum]|uniref:Secoisolariciresinol dehydrogenase-like n=1 Tax=Sesamum indicum TaxID=4182 RepID=A0A6I9U530_SESIN|nr:secoisolariciresinol dehydrogenase-like [Sesamum indicum]
MATTSLLFAVAKRLEGKVALITGGAGSLGSVTAKLFHEHGAKVLIADVQDDKGHLVCQNLSPESASFIHCDVTNESDIRKAVETAVSIHGKLDIMFNNAGIVDPVIPDMLNYNQTDFERVLRVNAVGAFLGTKHAACFMKQAKRGSIINTASVCSVIGGVATHGYTSSKHAIVGLTKNTAVELGRYGIRVNCVSPYAFPSAMSRGFFERDEDDPIDDIGSNLEGVSLKPEDVAEAVVYLASDESRYVSGHNLIVDGGFTVMNSALTMFNK